MGFDPHGLVGKRVHFVAAETNHKKKNNENKKCKAGYCHAVREAMSKASGISHILFYFFLYKHHFFQKSTWAKYITVASYPKEAFDYIAKDNQREIRDRRITISLAMIPGEATEDKIDKIVAHFKLLYEMRIKMSKEIVKVFVHWFFASNNLTISFSLVTLMVYSKAGQ